MFIVARDTSRMWFRIRVLNAVIETECRGVVNAATQCLWLQGILGEWYGTLLLTWPADWSLYKHEHIYWCWLSICFVTYPIIVNKPNQIKIRFSFVEDPMSCCSLNKVNDPFGCSPMDLMRLIHVSWIHTKYIRYIRLTVCNIQSTAYTLYYLP